MELELATGGYVFASLFHAISSPEAFMHLFPFMLPVKVSSFSFKALLVLVRASCGLHHFLIWSF